MRRAWPWLISAPVLLFLLLPLLALPLLWEGVPSAGTWLSALGNSLLIAAGAAALATVFGTPAALGFWSHFPGRVATAWIVAAPLLLPPVLLGTALLLASERTGLGGGHPGLLLCHALIGAPLVAGTALLGLWRIDPAQLRAAAACGAAPAFIFRRLVRPRLGQAVAAGAILAFAASIGETAVAGLLGARTLPIVALSGLGEADGALAALLLPVLVAMVLAPLVGLWRNWSGSLQGRTARKRESALQTTGWSI
jgi:putative spermidine/putrescine transport system permease protein